MNLINYDLSSNGSGPNRYGFLNDIKKTLGINSFYVPTSDWDHGWTYCQTSGLDFYKTQISKKLNFIVPNIKKAKSIQKYTNNKVFLAPLPFYFYSTNLLTSEIKSDNKKKLLIMPGKNLNFANVSKKNYLKYQQDFIENILHYKKYFREICICVHHNDLNNWQNSIEGYGIKIITGANPFDNNSYKRMYQIFSNFEYMSTNFVGSHIVYAASMNLKVSLFSEIIKYSVNENKIYEHFSRFKYLNVNEIINDYHNMYDIKKIREKLNFLFTDNPNKARDYSDWANIEIGQNNKKKLEDVRNLLGLNFSDQLMFYCKKLYSK